ncbi:Na+/H+ antiporter subunit G [Roseivivax sp. CAU 1753]
MTALLDILIAASLLIGAVFTLVGSFGLLKLDDPMKRLHAPTKAGTLGVGALIVASILHSFTTGQNSVHEILIVAFLFVTAPISAHFLSKVNIHRTRCDTPPDLPEGQVWATLSKTESETG